MKSTEELLRDNLRWMEKRNLELGQYVNLACVTEEEADQMYAEMVQELDAVAGKIN